MIAQLLGGKVSPGKKKEFGPALLKIKNCKLKITKDLPISFVVWMSHGDKVTKLPNGFVTLASTQNVVNAFIANEENKIYGLQFHPEVVHTQFGGQILTNFLDICNVPVLKTEIDRKYVQNLIKDISESIADKKAICALSGGVDSSVAALLVHKAIGNNLIAIYVDSGLMRTNETQDLKRIFQEYLKMGIKVVYAKQTFLKRLKKVIDPEQKRKIIGNTFIDVLDREAKKLKAEFLVQGTIYPDVIESAGTKHSNKIKSHHNVAGLPQKMKLLLIEPLRTLYKDEVRNIGKLLNLPDKIIHRQPFPGPGLAIRIIGEINEFKLNLLRQADFILQEEIKRANLGIKLWQVFAVLTGIKTTGVRGDNRAYGETIAIRAIEAKDAMTAHFSHLPYSLLDKIATRIVNEIPEVNRVVYDITNKPPATMEWE